MRASLLIAGWIQDTRHAHRSFFFIQVRMGKILDRFIGIACFIVGNPLVVTILQRIGSFIFILDLDKKHAFLAGFFHREFTQNNIHSRHFDPLTGLVGIRDCRRKMLAFGFIHLLDLLVEQIFISAVFAENVAGCSASLKAGAAGGTDE